MLSLETFFTKVKPACEQFIRSATLENLENLNKELQIIEDGSLDRFQSYLLIPLLMKMDNIDSGNGDLKANVAFTLNRIIKRIKVRDKSAIKTIIVVSLKQVYDFQTGKLNVSASEELKTAIIQCVASTFQCSTSDTLEGFYTKENASLIGKISVTCVELINNEKYRNLRIAAVESLMHTFYVHDSADFNDIVLRNNVADIVFVFLPKIVHTLITIANGDEKAGQKLIATSIKCLGRILCIIFEDYQLDQTINDIKPTDFIELVKNMEISNKTDDEILGINIKSRPLEERFKTLKELERNDEWLGASSRKLTPILKTMVKLRANPSKQIREEYVIMCCSLIEKCHKNLQESLPIFIENIFALSQDEDEAIRNLCKNLLHKMNENSTLSSILSDCVTSLFEMHLISLPRIIHRWEDAEQLAEFLFLNGILENAGEQCLSTVLCVPNTLEKFCNCLIVALELELNNELLKEEYAIRDIADVENEVRPLVWRKFKNINNEKIIILIQSICENLGKSKVFDLVFDHLIDILARDSPECNEVILILIMILNGSDFKSSYENILATLEEIFQDRRWQLELHANHMQRLHVNDNSQWYEDRTPGLYESAIEIRTRDINLDEEDDASDDSSIVNIRDAQINVLHTCLLLDAIGNLALILNEQFQLFMFKALHRVLQKASSVNYVVHQAGMFALKCLQKAFGLSSIPSLIEEYSNYISYHVNIALKRTGQDNSAIDILSTVLQYASFDSISCSDNIIDTILEESSKHEQSNNIESFLKIFHMILIGVEKWSTKFGECDKSTSIQEETPVQSTIPFDMYQRWVDVLNKVESSSEVSNIDELHQLDEPDNSIPLNDEMISSEKENEPESTNKSSPRHIEIVVKIIKEVLKFIASKNQMHKIISIECIITGLPLLKDYENELLPIVHLIWYPFAERFKEKDVIVLNRCFTLLEILAIHARDFILQRTIKEILPFLCRFLQESSKNSLGKIYLVPTQELKLQSKLLKEYPSLIESMEVPEREFDRISEAVLLYLNNKQPKLLQELAIEYFQKMSSYNCPAVYMKIISHLSDISMKDKIQAIIDFINCR